jgi:acetyl esterase/lipase
VPFTLGTAHRNLTYCHSQSLDLYIPRGAVTRPLPVAMYIHGGGMTAGDKSDLSPVFLDALASAGYVVASVNYRLAPGSRFPAQIEDVKCAIRYLRAKARKFGLNASEIFAFGTSVGGQLVTLAALTGPHSAWDAGPYPAEPATLAMVLPTAMQGIRAKVTDKVPWTMLGLGAGGIWLAVMFISIFTPVMVTGTAPWITEVPLASILSVIAGIVLTWLLCRMLKTAFFQSAEPQPGPATTTPTVALEPVAEDATVKLRRLAQLRDAGVITEAEFQAKKDELLTQI